jgi:hypothetical protein
MGTQALNDVAEFSGVSSRQYREKRGRKEERIYYDQSLNLMDVPNIPQIIWLDKQICLR